MASSLDQVGPVARSAADIALAFSVMAGRDPMDSTSVDLPDRYRLESLQARDLKGLRIGLPKEYFGAGLERDVANLLQASLREFEGQGAVIKEVSLPHTQYAIDTYYLLCTSEVSSNLSRFDGVRFGHRAGASSLRDMIADTRDQGLGFEVKRRILLGAFCLSKGYYDAFYLKAMKARTLIAQDFERAFESVDVLATPVSPGTAFAFGAKTEDPLAMYLADAFTVTAPLAGIPCLSMPAGFSAGLPVGIQLIGPAFSDVMLLETAHAFQSLTRHHLALPPLISTGVHHGL
jgi:aspartyl-tRNA(Asn)/glutamyl-tRNA(Gln) amidotransferase subunit A